MNEPTPSSSSAPDTEGAPLLRRIGVLSDTHNHLDPQVLEIFAGCDHILHAGDICKESILTPLREIAPLTVIQGNNDFLAEYPDYAHLVCNRVRFGMVHILPRHLPPHCDWLIFGHTHRPEDRVVDGIRLFNPGSAGMANKGAPRQVALLDWENGAWIPSRILL